MNLRPTWSRPICFLSSNCFFYFSSDMSCCRPCEFDECDRLSQCCSFFDQERDRRTQWTEKIRQCGYPILLWRCGQNPLVARNAPERVQSLVVFTTAQQGALLWCLNLADGPGGQSPTPLLRGGNGRQMHRHGSLPTTPSRARAGVRLQPAAAAPQGQPYYPDSSRVLHSCSGRCEMGLLPVIQTVETGFRVFWH